MDFLLYHIHIFEANAYTHLQYDHFMFIPRDHNFLDTKRISNSHHKRAREMGKKCGKRHKMKE